MVSELPGLAGAAGVKGLKASRKAGGIPANPRRYILQDKLPIIRNRRQRSIEFGDPELEQRAISPDRFPIATLGERVLFKKLAQLIGESAFIFQRGEQGGRNFIGGFVIDFLIIDRYPNVALETVNEYWHRAEMRYKDEERALVLQAYGYRYEEVFEQDIFRSDEYLEQILVRILGGRVSPYVGLRN